MVTALPGQVDLRARRRHPHRRRRLSANMDKLPQGHPAAAGHGARDQRCADRGADAVAQGRRARRLERTALRSLAARLRTGVAAKVDNVGLTFITGGQEEQLRVVPDPAGLSPLLWRRPGADGRGGTGKHGLPWNGARRRLRRTRRCPGSGGPQRRATGDDPRCAPPTAIPSICAMSRRSRKGPGEEDQARAWRAWAKGAGDRWSMAPGQLAIAKRSRPMPSTSSDAVVARVEALRGNLIPAGRRGRGDAQLWQRQ